jgi:hypothetical protein
MHERIRNRVRIYAHDQVPIDATDSVLKPPHCSRVAENHIGLRKADAAELLFCRPLSFSPCVPVFLKRQEGFIEE